MRGYTDHSAPLFFAYSPGSPTLAQHVVSVNYNSIQLYFSQLHYVHVKHRKRNDICMYEKRYGDINETHTNITKTSPCNEDSLTPHFYIVKLGFTGVYIIFLFLN